MINHRIHRIKMTLETEGREYFEIGKTVEFKIAGRTVVLMPISTAIHINSSGFVSSETELLGAEMIEIITP